MVDETKSNEATTPQNTVTIEDAGPCKKKVIVEIPQKAIETAVDGQYKELGKDAQIPGFRKGRAPRRLLEKRFGKDVSDQVKLKLLAEASESAIKDKELNILRDPDIDYEKIELPEEGELKFEFEIEVRPEFELPKLEGIELTKTKREVTDEQIDAEIEQLCKYSGVWAPRDEDAEAEQGDQIIADTLIKVEGVEEAEKLDNNGIFVRSNGFVGSIPVEKLDELLIGAKAGDTKETSLTVPKTYFKEEYRGKKVDIEITVKDIKWLKPAELNSDLFTRLGVEDENELREKIHDMLEGRLQQQANTELNEQIYRYMLDNTDFDLPVDVVADQASTILQRQYINMLRQGMPREKIEENQEQLRAGSEEQAKEQLKTFFIMDKVAEKLEIDVTEEEINGHIAQTAMQRGQRPERMREDMLRDGSLTQFRIQVREGKCIAKILETAKITEIEGSEAKKGGKKAQKTTKKAKKTTKKIEKTDDSEKKTTKKTTKKKSSEKSEE
jgi:trigger factor